MSPSVLSLRFVLLLDVQPLQASAQNEVEGAPGAGPRPQAKASSATKVSCPLLLQAARV
jgi:hypothetical protein